MRHLSRTLVVIIGCTLLALPSTVLAGTIDNDRPVPNEFSDDPGDSLDRPPRLPRPIAPTPDVAEGPTVFQLVGFTDGRMSANKGVLNYTLACQAEFAGSRMCTVEDINETMRIPIPPGYGLAWVRTGVFEPRWPTRSRASAHPTASLENTDCEGWTTTTSRSLGVAVDFGTEAGCYGGYHLVSCDQQLRVACCALRPLSVEETDN